MTQQLLLLVVGFVLTSVAGGALGSWSQRRAWAHQHELQLRDEERQREAQRLDEEHQRALKTFEEVSQAAPRESAAAEETPDGRPQLQIGDQGRNVRRLQRALRRAGQDIRIDGLFRQETWRALCSLQRSRGLDVDGITGPLTWAALPPDVQMPLLRLGRGATPWPGSSRS